MKRVVLFMIFVAGATLSASGCFHPLGRAFLHPIDTIKQSSTVEHRTNVYAKVPLLSAFNIQVETKGKMTIITVHQPFDASALARIKASAERNGQDVRVVEEKGER